MGSLPRRLVAGAFRALPESVRMTLSSARTGYARKDIPAPLPIPRTRTRLFIGRTNSAGQGWAWARAAERLDGVGAVSAQVRRGNDFGYLSDHDIPNAVFSRSQRWARRHFEAVSGGFSHVIAESQWPQFGSHFGGDVLREFAELQKRGITVASLCHGSDIRSPERHRAHEPHSPFHDQTSELTLNLSASTAMRSALLDDFGGHTFVSTPDLLLDRPQATWLPVVVDPARWQSRRTPLEVERPVVVHAPSFAGLKGTELVLDQLTSADAAGRIDFRLAQGVPADQMPRLIAESDVVIDQFSLGIYGVAACEAMASGRLVVSHVSDFVRRTVREEVGVDLPIVEANPDTLDDVLQDILDRPDVYRQIALRGPAFVHALHDGRWSADVLAGFLGRV